MCTRAEVVAKLPAGPAGLDPVRGAGAARPVCLHHPQTVHGIGVAFAMTLVPSALPHESIRGLGRAGDPAAALLGRRFTALK